MIIRKATLEERDAMRQLIADSARHLSRAHYNDQQIETAIETVFGVDTDLIDDGTYFRACPSSHPAACRPRAGRNSRPAGRLIPPRW